MKHIKYLAAIIGILFVVFLLLGLFRWEVQSGQINPGDIGLVSAAGTDNRYALFDGTNTLEAGLLSDDGTNVTLATGNLGMGTTSPSSRVHIKANAPGTVGSAPAGQLIIQDPDDNLNSNAVITGYESDGSGNPDQQLWYLGSTSSSNANIALINRQNAELHLHTNDLNRFTIQADGDVGIGDASPDAQLEILSTTSPQFRITHTDNVDHLDISVSSAGGAILQASGGQINLGNATGEITVIFDVLSILSRSTAPSPVTGGIYVDSDLNLPCFYNGTNWVQMDDFSTVCS